MNILICIDDTDNLESRGTGELATIMAEEIERRSWGRCDFVTRHQLLVHPDVPYTSHNSSMCFAADLDLANLDSVITYASDFLRDESAVGSDPGLCVSVIDQLADPEAVITYGRLAKKEVLNKKIAYDLAAQLGVHLSEHGGTGQGVVGALAGIGLRLSGNDGRMKGWLRIETQDGMASVADIMAQTTLGGVRTMEGELLTAGEMVEIDSKPKAVFLDGQIYLMVSPVTDGGPVNWRTAPRSQLKKF